MREALLPLSANFFQIFNLGKTLSNMATNAHDFSLVSLELSTLDLSGLNPRSTNDNRPKSHFSGSTNLWMLLGEYELLGQEGD